MGLGTLLLQTRVDRNMDPLSVTKGGEHQDDIKMPPQLVSSLFTLKNATEILRDFTGSLQR